MWCCTDVHPSWWGARGGVCCLFELDVYKKIPQVFIYKKYKNDFKSIYIRIVNGQLQERNNTDDHKAFVHIQQQQK